MDLVCFGSYWIRGEYSTNSVDHRLTLIQCKWFHSSLRLVVWCDGVEVCMTCRWWLNTTQCQGPFCYFEVWFRVDWISVCRQVSFCLQCWITRSTHNMAQWVLSPHTSKQSCVVFRMVCLVRLIIRSLWSTPASGQLVKRFLLCAYGLWLLQWLTHDNPQEIRLFYGG